MGVLETLGFNLGISFASGLNLYATVAVLGLLQRFHVIELPPALTVFSHPAVLGIALVLYAVEFFADKIPCVDTIWDAVHTFIRPPAAALMAYAAFGDVAEPWRAIGGMLAGGIALSSHGAKASARAAINTSPEPFSNWMASLTEDGIAIVLVWMAIRHPVLTIACVVVLLACSVYLLFKFAKLLKRIFRGIGGEKNQPPESSAGS